MPWRPRSILQLVLLGFFIVMAPLCAAIFVTLQTLDQQASHGERLSRELVALTRHSEQLGADLLDIERRARQYVTLGDARLLELFEEGAEAAMARLERLATLLEGNEQTTLGSLEWEIRVLMEEIPQLSAEDPDSARLLSGFDRLSLLDQRLRQAVQKFVDAHLQDQQAEALSLKESLISLIALLALVTLVSALFFTYWINAPIRALEREVKALGKGRRDRPIQVRGPLEMRLLGEQLEWLRGQLNQLEEQKRQFLRHMSHELKTPLASLREGADLLDEEVVGELRPAQREIVSIVQNNSWELQRLIENLLDYNQVLHQPPLETEEIELPPWLTRLMDPYRVLIERRQLEVSFEGGPERWPVDAGKLKTALDNLFSNAVNYAESGGKLGVRWRARADRLQIDVGNTGQALADEERTRVFEPFYQGRARRGGALKGSGIGLSVARECVEAQGGTLAVIDDPAWDVCFRLTLPRVEPA
ncbi:cell wall metabolism sensor histidine kinase WalK [Motiliproteus sp. SC1-56]|uniref:sensor histidine kinase n=1 Tax=Motiliproteus sp. SC1-56 TaxID=2799565 RepID=UPI001A8C8FBF|nr:ATP-binding protein [Motiliproteus sp. SC1-56]